MSVEHKKQLTVKLNGVSLPTMEEISTIQKFGIYFQTKQRKSFDEHYIIEDEVVANLDVNDLVELSREFHVEVDGDAIRVYNW